MQATVKIPGVDSGAVKTWAKRVKSIDWYKRGGYVFKGQFVRPGSAYLLDLGEIVIVCSKIDITKGAKPRFSYSAELLRVISDGCLESIETYTGRDWWRNAAGRFEQETQQRDIEFEKIRYVGATISRVYRERKGLFTVLQMSLSREGFMLEKE